MNAVIVIGLNYTYNQEDFLNCYVIGVDKGCLFCLNNSIPMDIAVGDFDSLDETTYNLIKNKTKVKKLNPIKDETDTNEAIKLCKDFSEILIVGGINGKRIEHFYANILELIKDRRIKIKDDSSYILSVDKDYQFTLKEYKYISLFSISDDTIISLEGMKYNLDHYQLELLDPICISNEVINDGRVVIHSGRVIVIYSKDDLK